jgi:hypothetical protein
MVTKRQVDVTTGLFTTRRTFKHEPILGCFTSDTPARCKAAKWTSHTAFLGCGACTHHGVNLTSDDPPRRCAMHFLGYAEKSMGGLRVPGEEPVSGFCGSSKFWLTHEEHVRRAVKVEAGEWDKQLAGCHGLSPVIKFVPYARYDTVFTCSTAHAMLLGLVKDFWGLLLCHVKRDEEAPWYSLPNNVRREMASRAWHVTATLDQSRPYRCIVKKRGNWVMEDWMNWTEIWSPFILGPLNGVSNMAWVAVTTPDCFVACIVYDICNFFF